MLATVFPGALCVYYGTEICMEGGYDPDSRRCFNWNQDEWDTEFLKEFKKILKMKKDDVIRYGTITASEKNGLLVVVREYKCEKIVLEMNMTKKAVNGIEPFKYRVIRKGEYNEKKIGCNVAS